MKTIEQFEIVEKCTKCGSYLLLLEWNNEKKEALCKTCEIKYVFIPNQETESPLKKEE